MPEKRAHEELDDSPFTEPHFSPTQVEMWCRCQRQYFFRYIELLKLPPRGARVRGIVVHRGISHDLLYKAEHGKDLSLKKIIEVSEAEFDEVKRVADFHGEKPQDVRDEAFRGVAAWHDQMAPRLNPITDDEGPLVERKFKVEFEGGFKPFVGIIDAVDNAKSPVIVDHKTSTRSYSPTEADRSWQLTAYALGYRNAQKKIERSCRIDLIVCGKKPVVKSYKTHRTQDHILQYLGLLGCVSTQVKQAVETGDFMPASPLAWWCSDAWCGYWDRCEYGSRFANKKNSV